MRAFLVKSAGLALYIHDLQSGTLTLTHERFNKEPKIHVLDDEDFDDSADEIDIAVIQKLGSGPEASAVGMSLRLVKNDGVLKMTYEGKCGGVVDWTFEGLVKNKMVASASTQTDAELSPDYGGVDSLLQKLSISTTQTISTNPTPERITQPLLSGLSTISAIKSRPITVPINCRKEGLVSNDSVFKMSDLMGHNLHKILVPPPSSIHKLARNIHDFTPWPKHLFMACYRIRPVHNGGVGVLHVDLAEGTAWFEGWSGKGHISQQTYVRKQIDLRSPSTSVGYFYYGGMPGEDFSTHQLRLSKINTNQARVNFFSADCSAPGYRVWGSDEYNNIGPIPHYSILDWNYSKNRGRPPISIPNLPAETTHHCSSPVIVIDALVHCIDRSSRRPAIHDPIAERKLSRDLQRGFLKQKEGCLGGDDMLQWIIAIQEVKKRAAQKKKMRVVEGVQAKMFKKKTKPVKEEKGKKDLKRKVDVAGDEKEKEDKKPKVEIDAADKVKQDSK